MGFKCGIIGLPNVGKSTLFNAFTKANVAMANFLFCTIKPNSGFVPVPDSRLQKLAEIVHPQHIIPATIQFVDVAGLVQGASKGEGLGNQFLTHIRNTEAVGHVVRCFINDNIVHVAGRVNPIKDIDIINTELILSDLSICERAIDRVTKTNKSDDRRFKIELEILKRCCYHLEHNIMLRSLDISQEEKDIINYLGLLTIKPTMYIANVNNNCFENNPYLDQVRIIAEKEKCTVIPICATSEFNVIQSNNKKCHNILIKNLYTQQSRLNQVIQTGYSILGLQTYFTVGIKEIRAWTIPIGTTALQAAARIHTNFSKGFIRVQTISYDDFITYKGKKYAKQAGRMRTEGKNYIVQDGDVLNFLFNI